MGGKMTRFEYPEGATPIQDCSYLKLPWVQTQRDLNHAELENIAIAHTIYLTRTVPNPLKWFDPSVLKKIHKEMYGKVWEWAGKYRKEVTSIGIKPFLIPSYLAQLCDAVKSWLKYPVELTFLEQAARIHHKMVYIHPFENGNGRFSRLIADRYLLYWGCPYPQWPIDLQKNGLSRSEYIHSLKNADQGNYDPLLIFMRKWGAKDPSPKQLLETTIFDDKLSPLQKQSIGKAILRIESY